MSVKATIVAVIMTLAVTADVTAKGARCSRPDVNCQGVAGGRCTVGDLGNVEMSNGDIVKTSKFVGTVSNNLKRCKYKTEIAGHDTGVDVGVLVHGGHFGTIIAPRIPIQVSPIAVGGRATLGLDYVFRISWFQASTTKNADTDFGTVPATFEGPEVLSIQPGAEVTFMNVPLNPSVFVAAGFAFNHESDPAALSDLGSVQTPANTTASATLGTSVNQELSDRISLRAEAGLIWTFDNTTATLTSAGHAVVFHGGTRASGFTSVGLRARF